MAAARDSPDPPVATPARSSSGPPPTADTNNDNNNHQNRNNNNNNNDNNHESHQEPEGDNRDVGGNHNIDQQEHEGYTPLWDYVMQAHDGAGPGGGSTLMWTDPTLGTTFFASSDLWSQWPSDNPDDDEQDEEEDQNHDQQNDEDHNEEGCDRTEHRPDWTEQGEEEVERTEAGVQLDFRSVADGLLSALEQDYQATLQRSAEPPEPLISSPEAEPIVPDTIAAQAAAHLTFDPDTTDPLPNLEEYSAHPSGKASSTLPSSDTDRPRPELDMDAVRRAVHNIALRDPRLQQNSQIWEQIQQQQQQLHQQQQQELLLHHDPMVLAPRLHALIPTQPLAAFRRRTDKARQASQRLTRSACLAEALVRLQLLQGQEVLEIHVLGCDAAECASFSQISTVLGPLVRWIRAHALAPRHLRLVLVGPHIPAATAAASPHPLGTIPSGAGNTLWKSPLESAVVTCHVALYHNWCDDHQGRTPDHQGHSKTPDLLVAFNAGVWDYWEWRLTLQRILQIHFHHRPFQESTATVQRDVPFVVTAYSLQEAKDDYEIIREEVTTHIESLSSSEKGFTNIRWQDAVAWEPEENLFSSRIVQETDRESGRCQRYRENAAWQCWRLGST